MAENIGVRVVEVDDRNLAEEIDMTSHLAWAPALTREQYQERERRLFATKWGKERLTAWALVPSHMRDKGWGCLRDLHLLASLETYRLDAIGPEGEEASVYGVASVFTQPQHRGKHYATKLCSSVLPLLKSRDPKAIAAVLYSDVGDTIYSRAGFSLPSFTPTHGRFSLLSDSTVQSDGPDRDSCLGLVKSAASHAVPIHRKDVPDLLAPVLDWLKKTKKEGTVLVLPSADQIDWLLEREYCCCEQMGIPPLPQAGAKIGETFMLWTMDVSKPKRFMKVLMCHHPDGSPDGDLGAVAAAAVSVALGADAYEGGVLSWGINGVSGKAGSLGFPLELVLASVGVEYSESERESSLPMLAPLKENVSSFQWEYVPQCLWL